MVSISRERSIDVFSTADELFQLTARDFSRRAMAAVKEKGVFSVVLSGGNTPKLFFETLTRNDEYVTNTPWEKIQFFFGDERYVPPDDINSNYHTAQEYLFSKVPISPDNIYRIPTEYTDPNEAAHDYEKTLRKAFQIKDNGYPSFDLIYLGLGDNAHTASLMPFSDIVTDYATNPLADQNHQLVASLFVSEMNMYRITLTPNAINNSQAILFMVTGLNKAMAVWNVLEGETDPQNYPAQLIHCLKGKTFWYLDEAAAKKLGNEVNYAK